MKYLKNHESFLGCKAAALFSRDEYQKDKGNLFHQHLVWAHKKDELSHRSTRFFEDLIRTSVFDVIRTDEVQSLMDKGLLKSVDEANDVIDLAKTCLVHKCGQRCKRLITSTKDGDPKNYKCRKKHPVKDSPDCSSHQYIPMNVTLSPSCIQALLDCGLCTLDENEEIKFSHPYFCPTSHMAPCNMNADCNMSPIITELFLLVKAMCNVQSVTHANGIVKYILKYIAKFDLANRVIGSANAHTGTTQVGSEFLHNTKITSSRHNEEAAFKKRRDKDHPFCRDIPLLEMVQLMLNVPEVTTNIWFIQISTLPFEVRARHKIQLNSKGRVTRRDNNNHDDDSSSGTFFGANADAHESGIPSKRVRELEELNLRVHQRLTPNQEMTIRDHNSNTRKFDKISMFGARPPELVSVFENPKVYYRLCYISDGAFTEEVMKQGLNRDLRRCKWFDCLGRRVYIRLNALEEVLDLVKLNMQQQSTLDHIRTHDINETIGDIIRVYNSDDAILDEDELLWKSDLSKFIFDDGKELLPVPVLTNVNPANSHEFFVHIVLSLGKYVTEIDVLHNASPRVCLEKARLIGTETDDKSRHRYVNELLTRYIVDQVVYYPNSLRKTDSFIVLAKRLFEEIILHDEFVANEIPFTVTEVLNDAEAAQVKWWDEMKASQLQSIYSTLAGTPNLPPMVMVQNSTRYSPILWNPVETMAQSSSQSEASFEEQLLAIKTNAHSIDKYCGVMHDRQVLTYTKNVITHGAPGSGKSFVGQRSVLYTLTQGLRCISTCLMGARANAIGGIHCHILFCLSSQRKGATIYAYREAEACIGRIKRKKHILHALLTVDVIFLDEAGQISSEIVAVIDIILRKLRKSQMPFGGVLVIGTLDHTQLQPINAIPFLMSSLVLTSFTMVQLKESVRAAEDALFCEFQQLVRMNPLKLRSDSGLKSRFYELAQTIFVYVDSWDDPRITPAMTRMYARKSYVKSATAMYTDGILRQFRADPNRPVYRVRESVDRHARKGSSAEYTRASPSSVSSLNHQLKEPETLVFHPWAVYECTTNDSAGRYNQSTIALLVDVPSEQVVNEFSNFPIWIAPAGMQYVEFLGDDELPTKDELRSMGWREVSIRCAPEREVNAKNNFQARRKQYALKHIGAITVNKSQGDTIVLGIALEMTQEGTCPWEKEQIVVATSRTPTSSKMIIVGQMHWVVNKLWELVTTTNQWTQMMENVLEMLTINSTGNPEMTYTLDYPTHYPFRLRDATLPSDSTGYIYVLISYRNPHFTYIGQTQNLRQRLRRHNSGHGAYGTSRPEDRPFAIAGYISGLVHYTKAHRMSLESQWREYRNQLTDDSRINIIAQGERIVHDQNANAQRMDNPDRINFVRLFSAA